MLLLKIPLLHNYILNRDWHWVLKCGIIADLCLKLCSSQVLWLKSGTCRIGYRNIVLFLFHYENISVGDFENINIRSLQLLPVTLWQHLLFCAIPVNMWHETITRLAYPSPSYSQPQRSVQILNDCICISDVYVTDPWLPSINRLHCQISSQTKSGCECL